MSAHQGPALPWSFVRFLSFWCDFWRYRVYIWSLSLDIYMLFVLVCLHFCVCKPMRECASPTLLPLIIHSRFQPPSHWNKTQSSSKSHSRTNVSQTATYCKCHPPPPTQYSKASVPTICRMLIRALCHLIPLAGTSGIRATLATVSYILNPLEPVGLLNTAFVYPSVCVCVCVCEHMLVCWPLRCLVKYHSDFALITEACRAFLKQKRMWEQVHSYFGISCYFKGNQCVIILNYSL